jgi:tRNA threonylcarbamoyladenosine biosynthesis protein TsaB
MSTTPKTVILQINTALREATAGIGVNGELMELLTNSSQFEHAAFLHPAIEALCSKMNMALSELSAVAVMNGPGSYTGLRVSLAAAKGICFALNIPLICINTLDWIAYGNRHAEVDLVCPMIDARRMEVFTAVYDKNLEYITKPAPLILEESSFSALLESNKIAFMGDGATKWAEQCPHANALFPESCQDARHFNALSFEAFETGNFANLITAEPFYLKGFHSTQPTAKKINS